MYSLLENINDSGEGRKKITEQDTKERKRMEKNRAET
jgi:hypothetical protein